MIESMLHNMDKRCAYVHTVWECIRMGENILLGNVNNYTYFHRAAP